MSTIYFNPENLGFYSPESLHIPDGSIEITEEKHRELLEGNQNGKLISADENGNPVLIDSPERELSAKEVRDKNLGEITYLSQSGGVIQARPQDESNIRNALEIMERLSLDTIDWRLADNSIESLPASELQFALEHGQTEAMSIWADYNQGV